MSNKFMLTFCLASVALALFRQEAAPRKDSYLRGYQLLDALQGQWTVSSGGFWRSEEKGTVWTVKSVDAHTATASFEVSAVDSGGFRLSVSGGDVIMTHPSGGSRCVMPKGTQERGTWTCERPPAARARRSRKRRSRTTARGGWHRLTEKRHVGGDERGGDAPALRRTVTWTSLEKLPTYDELWQYKRIDQDDRREGLPSYESVPDTKTDPPFFKVANDMGFGRERARAALDAASGNADIAMATLLG